MVEVKVKVVEVVGGTVMDGRLLLLQGIGVVGSLVICRE